MTPTWYDVLDVDADASEAEIRAAWKDAIADLDPGDRRFRTLNQAAEVLLDPTRRTAYDAELAARAEQAEPELKDADEKTDDDAVASEGPAAPGRLARPVPTWVVVAVGIVAAVLVAAAVWQWQKPSDDAVADAIRSAQAAAERAVPPVLSYDAADLEGSRSAAASYLTPSYQKERDDLFDDVIDDNAPNTGTKVVSSVVDSSVVRGTDTDRVQVFLFIDQSTTNKAQPQPQVVRTWVTMTMEKVDDAWLVAAMRVV